MHVDCKIWGIASVAFLSAYCEKRQENTGMVYKLDSQSGQESPEAISLNASIGKLFYSDNPL
jgi:hypothetical protein